MLLLDLFLIYLVVSDLSSCLSVFLSVLRNDILSLLNLSESFLHTGLWGFGGVQQACFFPGGKRMKTYLSLSPFCSSLLFPFAGAREKVGRMNG